MARFLISTIPVVGHVTPALPIARRLLERGHQVWWYCGSAFRNRIEATGAQFMPISTGIDLSDPNTIPTTWTEERNALQGLAQLKFDLIHAFIDTALGQVKDLQTILQEFPADVILADNFCLGAAWIYEQGGPLWASFGVGVLSLSSPDTAPFGLGLTPNSPLGRWRNRGLNLLQRLALQEVITYLDQARSQLGLSPRRENLFDIISPLLYLAATLPEFEYPRQDLPAQVHFIGPLLSSIISDFTPPSWWHDLKADRTVVHVTQGTVATQVNDLLIPTLQALAHEDVLVVATTGTRSEVEIPLNPIPDNARIERFIPYDYLLPEVDLMITNGGFNGVQMALANGIPLIAAGASEDKPEVCARIQWSGVGLNLRTKTPKPDQIKQAVLRIRKEPKYKQRAQEFQAQIAQYDAPASAVALLEQLIETRKPVVRSSGSLGIPTP